MKTDRRNKILALAVGAVLLSTVPASGAQKSAPARTSSSQASTSTLFSRERWGVSYFNYMNGPTFSESSGGSINHYFVLKHKFNPDWALSAVLRPDSNFGNGSSFLTMGDPYLRLEYPTLYSGGALRVSGDVRYSVPLSEGSRTSKIMGIISSYVKVVLDANRLGLAYVLIPKLYLNTLSSDGQKIASHGHYVSASYELAPKVSLDFALFPSWTLSRNRAPAFNDLPAYPGFTVNFSENLSVSPYMEIPLMKAEGKTTSIGGTLSYTLL